MKKWTLKKNKKEKPLKANTKKSDPDKISSWTTSVALRVTLISLLFIGMAALIPFNAFRGLPAFELNEPWRHTDLVAPFDFALKKPVQQYENEIEQIRANTPLIFNQNPNAYLITLNRLDSAFTALQPLISKYVSMRLNEYDGNRFAQMRDSVQYATLRQEIAFNINERYLTLMLDYYMNQALRQRQNQNLSEELVIFGLEEKDRINSILRSLYEEAIINIPKVALERDLITIRQPFDNSQQTLAAERLLDLSDALLQVEVYLDNDPQVSDLLEPALNNLLADIIVPNYVFDAKATEASFQDAIGVVSTNQGAISREQMIIRKGDLVTEESRRILQSLESAMGNNATFNDLLIRYSGDLLILWLLCIAYVFYFYLYARDFLLDNNKLLMVILSVLILGTLHRFISPTSTLSPYFTPLALGPILFTVFLNSRIGLVTAFFLPFMASIISGPDYQFVLSTILAGIAATYSSRDLKDRMQFYVFTPSLVFLCYLLIHTGFSVNRQADLSSWAEPLFYFGVNAAAIFFIYPLAMAFERLFSITTDFTLLELGVTNHPLLKELMNKAPGTFHHSLQVGSLSEAAANAIGANALLCKTACLYHDIGKIKRPYYFAENQSGENEHDSIKPSMSAMIIKDHVNQGVILAQEANLPRIIVDFIETHHGTTTIKYFYNKAQEQAEEGDTIDEKLFKYDGPLPFSRETGIVMLADTVEAASRAMKQPTYSKLENLINKLVDAKVDEGQLSNTPLTFKDVQKIKEVFLTILSGIYHSRVEYPDAKPKKDHVENQAPSQP